MEQLDCHLPSPSEIANKSRGLNELRSTRTWERYNSVWRFCAPPHIRVKFLPYVCGTPTEPMARGFVAWDELLVLVWKMSQGNKKPGRGKLANPKNQLRSDDGLLGS